MIDRLILSAKIVWIGSILSIGLYAGSAYSQESSQNCISAPELKTPSDRLLTVGSVSGLYQAVRRAEENTTIILKPGVYRLTAPVSVTTDNLTIRGLETVCDKVVLLGKGMENKNHSGVTSGFWIRAKNTTIANMTVAEIYNHPIQINGASDSPRIYNVRMVNAGQQFVKSNPRQGGAGVDNGIVEYSVMEYPDGPPKTDHDGSGTGYTNGVDVHGGRGWRIRNNRFINFHAPDDADHLWNAAILVWRGSRNTLTENNLFINVDRAIAYGLADNNSDHFGGIIRNNLIIMSPGLFSTWRRWRADAAILVWDSPGTKVLHNTILTNGNTPFAIESRWNNTEVEFSNNLADAPIVHSGDRLKREFCKFTGKCRDYTQQFAQRNETGAHAAWFINPVAGDLRLHENVRELIRPGQLHNDALLDFFGRQRPAAALPGAFQMQW